MTTKARKAKRENVPVCATHHTLAANLRKAMAKHPDASSQDKLAGLSGLSQSTISEMLAVADGAHEPSLDKLERVAYALGLDPWQLLKPPSGG